MTKMSDDAALQCLAESLAVLQESQLLQDSRGELRLARFPNPDRTDPEEPLLLNEADYLLRLIARAHNQITAVYQAAGGSDELLDEAVPEHVRSYEARRKSCSSGVGQLLQRRSTKLWPATHQRSCVGSRVIVDWINRVAVGHRDRRRAMTTLLVVSTASWKRSRRVPIGQVGGSTMAPRTSTRRRSPQRSCTSAIRSRQLQAND
jgi:hypothetical protein